MEIGLERCNLARRGTSSLGASFSWGLWENMPSRRAKVSLDNSGWGAFCLPRIRPGRATPPRRSVTGTRSASRWRWKVLVDDRCGQCRAEYVDWCRRRFQSGRWVAHLRRDAIVQISSTGPVCISTALSRAEKLCNSCVHGK